MHLDTCLSSRVSNEFKKSSCEPQNIEHRMSNIEVPATLASLLRFDILNFKYFCLGFSLTSV
jgi:hypothetical protein